MKTDELTKRLETAINEQSITISVNDLNICSYALEYLLSHRTEKEAKDSNFGDEDIKATQVNIGRAVLKVEIEALPKLMAECIRGAKKK